MNRWCIAGVVFPCIASIVQSFSPLWVFMALILTGMLSTLIGLILAQRKWNRELLIAKMDRAFGVKK